MVCRLLLQYGHRGFMPQSSIANRSATIQRNESIKLTDLWAYNRKMSWNGTLCFYTMWRHMLYWWHRLVPIVFRNFIRYSQQFAYDMAFYKQQFAAPPVDKFERMATLTNWNCRQFWLIWSVPWVTKIMLKIFNWLISYLLVCKLQLKLFYQSFMYAFITVLTDDYDDDGDDDLRRRRLLLLLLLLFRSGGGGWRKMPLITQQFIVNVAIGSLVYPYLVNQVWRLLRSNSFFLKIGTGARLNTLASGDFTCAASGTVLSLGWSL